MISSFPRESETSPRRKRARRGPKSVMTEHVSLVGEEKHRRKFRYADRADEFLRKHVRGSDAFAISEVVNGILCAATRIPRGLRAKIPSTSMERSRKRFTKTPNPLSGVVPRYVKGAVKSFLGEITWT